MAARLGEIRNFVTGAQNAARSPLETALMMRSLRSAKAPMPHIMNQDAVDSGALSPDDRANLPGRGGGTRVANAGLYDTFVDLPGNSGPPDPSIEPTPIPQPSPTPTPTATPPTGSHSGGGGGYTGEPGGFLGSLNFGFSPIAGERWLGGNFDHVDPMTGQPVYNPLGYGSVTDLARYNPSPIAAGGAFTGTNLKPADGHSANWWVF